MATGDRRLSKQTRREIAIKIGLRRIEIDLGELLSSIAEDAFEELPVRANHTLHLASLPPLHNDPFDRLLIAQAIAEDCRLVTRDESVLAYSVVSGFDPIRA